MNSYQKRKQELAYYKSKSNALDALVYDILVASKNQYATGKVIDFASFGVRFVLIKQTGKP